MEELKPIPNFPGYLASASGQIYSVIHRGRYPTLAPTKPRKLKLQVSTGGYLVCALVRDGKRSPRLVNRLVCMAFHGAPPSGYTASHLNGVNTDNQASNLKWETYSDNLMRKHEHGTDDAGSHNSQATLNHEQVLEVKKFLRQKTLGVTQIAALFNVRIGVISKINTGRTYKREGGIQVDNKNPQLLFTFNGVTKNLRSWAKEYGLSYITVHSRYRKSGWSIERALNTPVQKKKGISC
jgi:hypothetical protein